MTSLRFHGYDFGCRQPCFVFAGDALLPASADPAGIEAWLREVFLLADDEIPAPDEAGAGSEFARERRIVQLTVALHNELLRRAGVPVFDPGKVLAIERDTDAGEQATFRIRLALPVVDTVPIEVFTGGFANSLRLVTEHLTGKPDFDRISPLLDQLHDKVIKPMQARFVQLGYDTVPSGHLVYAHDIPARYLGNGVKRLGWGANARLMHYSSVQGDSAIGAGICRNKYRTAQFLQAMGLPAAEQALVAGPDEARSFARKLGWPLVVKPAVGERSAGVTIDITDEDTLARAFAEARKLHPSVIVERRVPGVCHRIAVYEGEILYARSHRPKGVLGDGKRTVRELAERQTDALPKAPPWRRMKPFPVDDIAVRCLAYDGLTPDSVPEEGRFVRLRPIMRSDWGATMEQFTETIHPANADACKSVCRALGLAIGGVDMISEDITRPWYENGAIINEVNYMPQAFRDLKQELEPRVAQMLVPGDGRIPVHLVVAEHDAFARAAALRKQLAAGNVRCHVTGADRTENAEGEEIVLAGTPDLFDRSLALLGRPDVQAIVLAASASDPHRRGFAMDRIDKVHIAAESDDEARAAWQAIDARVRTGGFARLDP